MQLAQYSLAVPYLLNPVGIVGLMTISAGAKSLSVFAVEFGILVFALLVDVVVFRWASRVSEKLDENRMLVTTCPQPPVGSSKDGAAWSHLQGRDAPAVEHYEPVAVPTAQNTVIFSKGRDDAVRYLVDIVSRLFVSYIQVLAANEADAQHDLCHGHAP